MARLEVTVGDATLPLRCSVGVGCLRDDLEVPEQLIDLADEALRLAKQSGRDQVKSLDRQGQLESLAADRDLLQAIRADELMLAPPITIDRKTPVWEVADQLIRLQVDSLPVVDAHGNLVGRCQRAGPFSAASAPRELGWSQLTR